jgi:hypothetical protein
MATTLYFRALTSDYSSGNNDAKLNGTAVGWDVRALSTARGAAAATANTVTVAGPTNGLEMITGSLPHAWYSLPLGADVTIAGSITWNLRAFESSLSANVAINAIIEKVDGATGAVTLIDQTARTTEVASGQAVNNFAETPAAGVACKRGDRLRVRVYGRDAGTMATGFNFSFVYDGPTAAASGDSYFTLTENLIFASAYATPAGTTLYLTDTASAVATASVDRVASTSRGAGVQTDVRNTAAGPTAPLQMTDTAGGTVVDWFSDVLPAQTLGGIAKCNIRMLESSAAANVSVRVEVAVVAGDGTSPVVWGAATASTEPGTTESAQVLYVSGPDTSITAGQRLRIRIYADDCITQASGVMGTGLTCTLFYAGTSAGASGDTWIQFSQNIFTYNPLAEAGLLLWLDADSLAQTDGSVVASWPDLSGNGYTFTSVSTAQPIYKTAVAGARGGVRFDGSDDTLTNSAASPVLRPDLTGMTVFAVFRLNVAAKAWHALWALDSSTGLFIASDLLEYWAGGSLAVRDSSGSFVNGALTLIDLTWSGTSVTGRRDGATGATSSSAAAIDQWGHYVGKTNDPGDAPQGDLHAIIVYQTALATADRQSIEGWLAWRYGTVASLPSGHPYKTVGPNGETNTTTYTLTLTGAMTPVGALIKKDLATKTGAVTSSGVAIKAEAVTKTGANTPSGLLIKKDAVTKTGGATPTGSAVARTTYLKSATGSVSPVGALIKNSSAVKTGASTPTGLLVKRDLVVKTGSAGIPTGFLSKKDLVTKTGANTPAGFLTTTPAINPPTSYAAAVFTDTPAAYWRLGEPSGTTANDSSGNGNTGTYIGSPTLGSIGLLAGDSNTAVTFNGTSQWVDVGNASVIQVGTGSVEAWFKTSSPGTAFRSIATKEGAYSLLLNDGELGYYDWTATAWRGTGVFPADGARHHAVQTFQSGVTNGTKVYLDGTLIYTGTLTVSFQTAPLLIAANASIQQLNGVIDEVAVYGSVLSSTRVSAHYTAGISSGAGVGYTKSLTGSVSPGGVLLRQSNLFKLGSISNSGFLAKKDLKTLLGSVASSSTLIKADKKILTGTAPSSGALVKFNQKILTGGVTSSGTLSIRRSLVRILTGSITPAGTLSIRRSLSRILTGSITPTGVMIPLKVALLSLSGTIATSGTVIKRTARFFTGAVTQSGVLTIRSSLSRILTGSVTPSGTVAVRRALARILTGNITPTGTAAALKVALLPLAGSINSTGALLRKSLATKTGTVPSTGLIVKKIASVKTGSITPTGILLATRTKLLILTGAISSVGSVIKRPITRLAGTLVPTGDVRQRTSKTITGTVTSVGSVAPQQPRRITLIGSMLPVGTVRRTTAKILSGVIQPVGVLATEAFRATSSVWNWVQDRSGFAQPDKTTHQTNQDDFGRTSQSSDKNNQSAFGSTKPRRGG